MNQMQSAFELVKTTKISSLNIELEEYQHRFTRAVHYHLASDNKENVFLVALRTVPTDSTGVAHILEHTSLCGSEKYPVRDPFFMMIRRSLNTFMNAFTSSDWTAYPFASQSRKDFENLRSVYLDAVFFANLDPLDFQQEGYRVEFEEFENSTSELVYKGVVFNEMKGAMSSISSQLWQAVGEQLFPDTTYRFNSGGDPAAITDLSYEQLKQFYDTHYHPDNAVFMTFGDIAAVEHQVAIHEQALKRFSTKEIDISVPLQKVFSAPVKTSRNYAFAEAESTDPSTDKNQHSHHVLAWVIGSIKDPLDVMRAHLLSAILLENSASPLQRALETSTLGKAPSPLCGVDDSGLQMIFICGLEGCKEESQADVEQLVINTLSEVAKSPPEYEQLEALLDQLEMQQREITGDGYPYGLQIILSGLATAMHRGSVSAALDLDKAIKTLREQIRDNDFVANLITPLLLDNSHRCVLSLHPDNTLAQLELDKEKQKLKKIQSSLSPSETEAVIATTAALQKRQQQKDDPDVLPKVGLEDVPEPQTPPIAEVLTRGQSCRNTFYPQGTNGIVYHQLIADLPELSSDELELLATYNSLATELGVGEKDYLQTQLWQSAISGGINSYSTFRSSTTSEQEIRAFQVFSSKGLAHRSDEIIDLINETRQGVRFNEPQRIIELIAQSSARAQRSVTGRGHSLAMTCASQGMSPLAKLTQRSSGTLGIQRLRELEQSLAQQEAIEELCTKLTQLHEKLRQTHYEFVSISEKNLRDSILEKISSCSPSSALTKASTNMPSIRDKAREIWICNSQVNFCAKAYPTVHGSHEDAAALTVLGGILRNGFLHTAIREQGGAYGGGASQDNDSASFKFYSYRDPRLLETLDDFDQSINWLLNENLTFSQLEEAILGVVSAIDKPSSPAGTAKQHFHNLLFDRTPTLLNDYRNRILETQLTDIQRVAEKYFAPDKASIAVLSHRDEEKTISELAEREAMAIHSLI